MPALFVPSPLDSIGRRRFAIDPAIANSDCNQWLLGASSKCEVQFIHAHSGRELWIPRQYIAGVSENYEGLPVVGLTEALECRNQVAGPKNRRLLRMPLATQENTASDPRIRRFHTYPAQVVGIKTEIAAGTALARTLQISFVGTLVLALISALLAGTTGF